MASTTTIRAIRDRMLDVLEAITPTMHAGTRFERWDDGDAGDFVAWATGAAGACFRRCVIRDTGERNPPSVSNSDVVGELVVFEGFVAYPETARAGARGVRDRDDLIEADRIAIDHAIGMHGHASFTAATSAPASWIDGSVVRVRQDGIDFLVIRVVMHYYRARTP